MIEITGKEMVDPLPYLSEIIIFSLEIADED
jgi:hypothetical protein